MTNTVIGFTICIQCGNVFRIVRKGNLDSWGKTYECTRTGEMGD